MVHLLLFSSYFVLNKLFLYVLHKIMTFFWFVALISDFYVIIYKYLTKTQIYTTNVLSESITATRQKRFYRYLLKYVPNG